MRESVGNCVKYLKREWNRKEGKGNKDFKRGASWVKGLLSQKGGGGLEHPYELLGQTQYFRPRLSRVALFGERTKYRGLLLY